MNDARYIERGPTEFYLPVRKRLIPVQSLVINFVLLALGLALIFQPQRWSRTPAYANLLLLLPANIWGVIHLVLGCALAVAVFVLHGNRTVTIVVHTLVIMLLAIWDVAFVVRYLTDSSTTVVNVVSWGTYVFLAVRSALLLDHPVVVEPRPNP